MCRYHWLLGLLFVKRWTQDLYVCRYHWLLGLLFVKRWTQDLCVCRYHWLLGLLFVKRWTQDLCVRQYHWLLGSTGADECPSIGLEELKNSPSLCLTRDPNPRKKLSLEHRHSVLTAEPGPLAFETSLTVEFLASGKRCFHLHQLVCSAVQVHCRMITAVFTGACLDITFQFSHA